MTTVLLLYTCWRSFYIYLESVNYYFYYYYHYLLRCYIHDYTYVWFLYNSANCLFMQLHRAHSFVGSEFDKMSKSSSVICLSVTRSPLTRKPHSAFWYVDISRCKQRNAAIRITYKDLLLIFCPSSCIYDPLW